MQYFWNLSQLSHEKFYHTPKEQSDMIIIGIIL